MSKKTINSEERIEGLMNIAANNKLRGSKFIKPSYSALGRLMGSKKLHLKYANQLLTKETFRYN